MSLKLVTKLFYEELEKNHTPEEWIKGHLLYESYSSIESGTVRSSSRLDDFTIAQCGIRFAQCDGLNSEELQAQHYLAISEAPGVTIDKRIRDLKVMMTAGHAMKEYMEGEKIGVFDVTEEACKRANGQTVYFHSEYVKIFTPEDFRRHVTLYRTNAEKLHESVLELNRKLKDEAEET